MDPELSDEERELRKQGLATGKPNLLDDYQRYLNRQAKNQRTKDNQHD